MAVQCGPITFDLDSVEWQPFGTYTGFSYFLLNVDVDNRVIDLLFRFNPNEQCFVHRHHQPCSAFVLHGEQHVWEIAEDGSKSHTVRPAGHFCVSEQVETHIEGGGPDGCIVYQSIRGADDLIYSIMDDDLNSKLDVTVHDFASALQRQAA